ncbi:MAG: hypothetical protein ACO34J_12050 [Prochlorothrix sp.]
MIQHWFNNLPVVGPIEFPIGAMSTQGWVPGLGDPSVMGQVTVVVYGLAALLCALCGIYGSRGFAQPLRGQSRKFWWGMVMLLVALGINKQLDLQSLLTFVGREMAVSEGWYDRRRSVQRWFIAALVLGSLAGITVLGQRYQQLMKTQWCAAIGLLLLLLFVLGRAASFHHVDQLINVQVAGLRLNWVLELGGLGWIALAAIGELIRSYCYRLR